MKNLLAILTAILALAACGDEAPKNAGEKPTIKIGAALPLSGNESFTGEVNKKALEMQLAKELKRDLKYNYEIIYENNESATAKTATAVRKLIYADKVDALLSIWNMYGIVVAEAANPKHILNLTCSWEDEALRGPYTYNMVSTHEQMSGLMVSELKKRGVESVAVIADNTADTIMNTLVSYLEQAGIKIVLREKSVMGQTDFLTEVAKGIRQKPDMFIAMGSPPLAYVVAKRLFEATGEKNITTIDGFMEAPQDQRPMFERLWYVDSNVNGNEGFERDLWKEKGVYSQSCAGNSAANLQILIWAYENTPVREGEVVPRNEDVNEFIKDNAKNLETVAAGKATLIRDGVINVEPVVKIIENGVPAFMKE